LESYTLYLDGAGDPGWPPPFGKSRNQWYIFGGLALKAEADYSARLLVDEILKKYIPESERQKWPERYYEIHYADIIFGHNIYAFLEPLKRKSLSDEVFQILVSLKPVLFATAINKLRLKEQYGNNAYDPRDLGFRGAMHRFAMYLNNMNSIGTAVIDEEQYRKDKLLQKMMHEFRHHGIIIRGWKYQPQYEEKLERVLNTVSFAPSETSPGIQFADVVVRATWSHFEHSKSNRFGQLEGYWNSSKDGSKIYDPSIVPKR
jgi:hypothetical protein